MAPRRLDPSEWDQRAEPALSKVFRSYDFDAGPFRDVVSDRLIIATPASGFFLDPSQFLAISAAARGVGDTSLLYSYIRGYTGGPECLPYHTWEIPVSDYEAYDAAEDEPLTKECDIGIPLDRVLYSPTGAWAVLLPDILALIGGSSLFTKVFKNEYPDWEAGLEEFLAGCSAARGRTNVDLSWVQRVLDHAYGEGALRFADWSPE